MRLAPLALALLVLPLAGADVPVSPQACWPETASVEAFAAGQGVVENLFFDGRGYLFVTREGDLWRYTPDGVGELYLDGIGGGMTRGWDDENYLYAGVLNNAAESILQTGASSVARIDLDTGERVTFASGFDMANGLTVDLFNNVYVSNDFGDHIVRIDPNGTWTEWAEVYSANGMVVADGELYAALTFDQRSPIVAISLDDPTQQRIVAELSTGALTLQPGVNVPTRPSLTLAPQGLDDMTLGPDGALYVAAQVPGAVLRVDRATGDGCVWASGMPNASSVRFAHGFGPWDGAAFVTAFDGHIWALR